MKLEFVFMANVQRCSLRVVPLQFTLADSIIMAGIVQTYIAKLLK